MPRMPRDSFEQYVNLGPNRSYAKLAKLLGCDKRSVTARAGREHWQDRLAEIDAAARAKFDKDYAGSVAAVNDRHLRTLRAIQGKALQVLSGTSMGTASQAASVLIAAVRAERAIVTPPETKGQSGPGLAELIQASYAAGRKRDAAERPSESET